MRRRWLKYIVLAAFLGALAAAGQTVHEVSPCRSRPVPTSPSSSTGIRDVPGCKYTISVDDAGNTHFQGDGNPIESGDGDDYSQDFTMSDANRQKIFDLAKKADYFQGNFEAKQKNIAKPARRRWSTTDAAGGEHPGPLGHLQLFARLRMSPN